MAVTWADVVSRGRGTAEFRLVIEGVPYQFCTAGMTTGTLADGRQRVYGLRREGLGFSESVYLAGAEIDVSINAVQIDDSFGPSKGLATWLFSTIAQPVDYLVSSLTAAGTTAYVRDSALFSTSTWYYAATETWKVTGKDTGADTLTITRGEWDSTGQAHYVDLGERASVTPVWDHPPGFVQRRVWLYAHGPTELGTSSSGTCVWRAVIGKEPSEADGIWTLTLEPRTKLLDAPLAGGFDKGLKLRGIYYPGEGAFRVTVVIGVDENYGVAGTSVPITVCGLFETQRAFLVALESALNTDSTISGAGVSFQGRELPDGTWDLYVRTPTPAKYIQVFGGSLVDGHFSGLLLDEPTALELGGGMLADPSYQPTVAADTMYRVNRIQYGIDRDLFGRVPAEDLRRVPRSNNVLSALPLGRPTDAERSSYPRGRLHVVTTGSLTVGDALVVTPAGAEDEPVTCTITSAGAQYLDAYEGSELDRPAPVMGVGSFQASIAPATRYGGGDGDLADLRDDLITRAPDVANRGAGPWVTSDDLASWTTAVAEASNGRSWLAHRSYVFAKHTRAIEVIKEECKLAGLFPYFDADAKLALRPLTLETRTATITIDADTRVIDDGFGSVSGDDDGLCTAIEVSTGYDPAEDKHVGETYRMRNLSAIARVKREAVLEIRPKSRAVGPELGAEAVFAIGRPLTELFGARRTQTVKLDVSLALFDLRLGDAVEITVPQLPGNGTRGVWSPGSGLTARRGFVTGRAWDLEAGRGTLTVLLHELAVAGYTPSGRVSSASGSGTGWTLTLEASRYSGTTDASFFTAGDAIRIVEWDATSPTTREGVVESVSGNEVVVTLATSWTGLGGAIYILTWDSSNDADTVGRQLLECFVSGNSGRVETATGYQLGRVFAP